MFSTANSIVLVSCLDRLLRRRGIIRVAQTATIFFDSAHSHGVKILHYLGGDHSEMLISFAALFLMDYLVDFLIFISFNSLLSAGGTFNDVAYVPLYWRRTGRPY